MIKEWCGEIVVSHGEIFQPAILPGFAAILEEQRIGLSESAVKPPPLGEGI
jgi:hypothetical protein